MRKNNFAALPFVILSFLPALSVLNAQEVKYVDLRGVEQRTQLRHPPAAPCEGNSCGGFVGGGSVSDGAPDQKDPHALGVYLLSVPTEINPAKPFQVEFRVLNTGLAPIDIPTGIDLSDLQPEDEAATFHYYSLALVVETRNILGEGEWVTYGTAQLYGAPGHGGTMLTLKPGEWIRVSADIKLKKWPGPAAGRFRGGFWSQRCTFTPRPGSGFTAIQNLYPNTTPTPWIPVTLLRPTRDDSPSAK